MSFDKPFDGEWFSAAQDKFVSEQRAELEEHYGPEAVETTVQMVAMFGDLIYIGRDNIPLIKAGLQKMAELVNGMLPDLERGTRRTRPFDHHDLDGCMDPIPANVQDIFVALVGTVFLNSKGGPFDTRMTVERNVDELAERFRAEGRELQ